MALPVTISTSLHSSERSGHTRPFRSAAGDIYVVLSVQTGVSLDTVQDGDLLHVVGQIDDGVSGTVNIDIFKATDPTDSFSVVDTSNRPAWSVDTGDSEVYYSRFNMVTDSWEIITGGNEEVIVDDVQNSQGEFSCFITQRADGDLIVVYQGFRDKFMGVDRPKVSAAVSTDNGATWTNDIDVSPIGTATDHYVGPIVIPPNNNDQAHIFYQRDPGADELGSRAMDNANNMRTARNTGVFLSVGIHPRSAMAFDRGGSSFVKLLYSPSNQEPAVYEMTPFSDDTDPLGSDSTDLIVAEDVNIFNQTPAMDFVFDPATETIHVVMSDVIDDDLQHHDDQGSDTWQDNGAIVTGTITGSGPFLNILDRDGAKIGFVYEDSAGDVFYDEIDVSPAATTALSDVDMAQQNLYQGPFGGTGDNKYGIFLTNNDHDLVAVKATTASPVDADWDSVDSLVRVTTSGVSEPGLPGWQYQDPIKSLWVHETRIFRGFFDVSDAGPTDPGAVWTNDIGMFDRQDGSRSTASFTNTTGSSSADYLEGQGTDLPPTGPAISSGIVRVRAFRGSPPPAVLGMRITTDGAAETLLDTTQTLDITIANYDFTLSTPSGGWTWAKLQALEVRVWRDSGAVQVNVTNLMVIVTSDADEPFLYAAYQHESGNIGLSIFAVGADVWSKRDEYVAKPGLFSFVFTPSFPAVAISIRPSGDPVIVAANESSGGEQRLNYVQKRQEPGWSSTSGFAGDAVVSEDEIGVVMMNPASDGRISWAYNNDTDDAVRSGSLGEFGGNVDRANDIDTAVDTALMLLGPGIIDDDDIIFVPYIDASNKVSVAEWASGVSPSATIHADVSDVNVFGQGRATIPFAAFCLALEGTTDVHLVYSRDSDQDISHDKDVDGGGTTDDEIVDAVTADRISCRVIGTDICLFYDDGGTTKFHCEALAVAARKAGRLLLLGVGHGA